jgi:hypothetical protein
MSLNEFEIIKRLGKYRSVQLYDAIYFETSFEK